MTSAQFVALGQRNSPGSPSTSDPGRTPVRWSPVDLADNAGGIRARDPAAAPRPGARRHRARVVGRDRDWEPARRLIGYGTPAGRGRAARESRAWRHLHESRDEARPSVSQAADGDRDAACHQACARCGRTSRIHRSRPPRWRRPASSTCACGPQPLRAPSTQFWPSRTGGDTSRRSDRAPSTSSSSRPTRPGRSPSGTPVAPSSATC